MTSFSDVLSFEEPWQSCWSRAMSVLLELGGTVRTGKLIWSRISKPFIVLKHVTGIQIGLHMLKKNRENDFFSSFNFFHLCLHTYLYIRTEWSC